MPKINEIRYKYARNVSGGIIFVEDLENSEQVRSEKFICISCENELVPKLGEIRQKHFAHRHNPNCSKETYLHKLAKEKFYQEYSYCLNHKIPFNIELAIQEYCDRFKERFGSICDIGANKRIFDLTRRYKKILLESNDGDFIPDILLLNDDESKKLYIEIAVTHQVSQKKKESQQIIELKVKNELDISIVRERLIRESSKVKFYNINPKSLRGKCKGIVNCPNKAYVFRVYDNRKILFFPETYPRAYVLEKFEKERFTYCKAESCSKKSYYEACREKLVELSNEGIKLRNCYLCRYHAENRFKDKKENPIFCKFLKESFDSNYAIECEYFKLR